MENTYKELRTDTELLTAALLRLRVYIVATMPFDPDELVDYGGPIQKYTEFSIRIGGVYYSRQTHIFKVSR